MADLAFTVVDKVISIVLNIKEAFAKVDGNVKECHRFDVTLDAVRTIMASVQETPMMEDEGIRSAMLLLEDVLVSTQKEINACPKIKSKARHAMKAGAIAEKLNKANQDLTQTLCIVVFALLAKYFRPAHPPPLPPGREMVQSVQPSSASNSTNDTNCYRNGKKEETKKTDSVATTSSGYLALEQKEKGAVSIKSDVFSSGIILPETICLILYTTSEKGHPHSPEEWLTMVQDNDWGSIHDPAVRPSMAQVIEGFAQLKEQNTRKEVISCTSILADNAKKSKGKTREIDGAGTVRSGLKSQKNNVTANSKDPFTSVPDGSLKFATNNPSMESVTGQCGPSIVNKDPTDDAGYINKRKSKTNKIDGCDAIGNNISEGKHEKNSVLANSKAPCTPVLNGLTGSASVKRVTRQGGSSIVNKIRSLRTSETGKLIDVYPQELRFPFEGKKEIQCPVTLTNRTDHHVGVWITQTSPKPIEINCPSSEIILKPHSTLVVFVTLESKKQKSLQSKGKFQVLMIVLSSKKHLRDLKPLNMDSDFWEKVENLQCEVYRAMLTAVICDPARDHIIVTRSTESLWPLITSIDVHPIKTWILMGHKDGHISIWNYEMKRLTTLQVNKKPGFLKSIKHKVYDEAFKDTVPHGVYSVKFISRKKWLVAGDGYGYVHVYAYTNNGATVLNRVKSFKACSGNSIDSLAVHPSMPYLLSSSVFHNKIELWNWDNCWSRFQEFDVKTGVHHLSFNPRDTNTFACITYDKDAMFWNIESSSSTTTLPGPYDADYLFAHTHQHHFLANLGLPSHSQTKEKVQSLCVSGHSPARRVAWHPTLPLLATTLDDGCICLWDANSYRLEKMIHITDNSSKEDLVFTVSNGLTRLVARSKSTIAAIEVNWPMARTGQRTGGRSS